MRSATAVIESALQRKQTEDRRAVYGKRTRGRWEIYFDQHLREEIEAAAAAKDVSPSRILEELWREKRR